ANLHHLPDLIQNYFGDGSALGVSLKYAYEPVLMGTAGGVKNNQHFLDSTFLVISGDALTDIDLTAFVKQHRANKALASIALLPMASEEIGRFGVVKVDDELRITGFQEKPRIEEAISNLVNTGIYVFEPEIFRYIPDNTFFDFGKELFPRLAEEGLPFYGYITNDYWCDVGTLEAYEKAKNDVQIGRAKLAPVFKPEDRSSLEVVTY
ncbi:MAG TPA: nucleotidyltransferase family protein, partial [Bacillota bacterium]|nr:nucleotidyltransferase family protein [Bacillota bacterium]